MFARLTALVGSGGGLPFEVGEAHPSAWGQWAHFKGTLKADGSPVSVFRVSAPSANDPKLRAARNGVKRLRTLRHPNILSFKDTAEVEERGETAVYLVTEAVSPLWPTLRSLGVDGPAREQYLSMGLHQVVSALAFLNGDCRLVHGNLCAAAVVVTDSLDWKLHAFDLTTDHQFSTAPGEEVPLTAAAWMVGAQYKPGEVARGDWGAVREGPAWGVDAWGLGCLMQELFSGAALARTEDLRNIEAVPQPLLTYYQRLLASQPSRRLDPAKLAESGVLRTKLVDLVAFLENLSLKDSAEKDAFFRRLPAALPGVPRPVAQRKLLPLLAAALEYGGAPPLALGSLLAIGEGLGEEARARQVVPLLTRLFASTDRGIRRGLLESVGSFGAALPAALVEDQIYPHVQAGFGDPNPYLRELTLKSMVVLGPKLSQRTLNQGLLKHLAKLQVDEEPAIRANTTVLLGTLAPQLGDATRGKVLLNAFGRALRDPFPPARAAGLRAVLATAEYHSPEDAAARVVPMVGPLCADGVGEVRAAALQCLQHFAAALKKNHEAAERREAAAAAAGGAEGGAAAGPAGGLLTSFGWAVSSLVAGGGAGEPPPAGGAAAAAAAAGAGAAGAGANGSSSTAGRPPARPAPAAAARPAAPAAAGGRSAAAAARDWDEPAAPAGGGGAGGGGGGWEDDDDPFEDMMDGAAAEREARQKLSRATLAKPAARPPAKKLSSGGSGGGWEDSSWDAPAAAPKPAAAASAPSPVRSAAVTGARRPAAAAAAAPARRPGGGGGMKLVGRKLAETDDFSEW